MIGAPRSKQFDDVYFSAENGMAETHHVFVQGNNLPATWQALPQNGRFTIVETGFGTGLNFLLAWKLFEELAPDGAQLDFISFERFPLKENDIRDALKPFEPELKSYLNSLLEQYPILTPGFHRLDFGRIRLTLILDDINEVFEQVDTKVDAWFLDGFTPSKNPEMWTETVFQNMARLSQPGSTFSTFTAAGFVKRGLQEAGFVVEKADGFGSKRDMLGGTYPGDFEFQKQHKKTIAIIGGGLSGASCAYALKQRGLEPVIYEAGNALASGASGNSLGLFNPRFCANRNGDSDFYTAGFSQFIRTAKLFQDIDFKKTGALHLINTEEKEKRFSSLIETWRWPEECMRVVNQKEASELAGITVEHSALHLPDSGFVSPQKLCAAYAAGIEVRSGNEIQSLDALDEDIVILAGGADMKRFVPWLPVHFVRGQVTTVQSEGFLKDLKCNIHYGGYVTASYEGQNRLGATFQKWMDHTDILQEDHEDNITKLQSNISGIDDLKVSAGWAGLRTSSKDRFPIAGVVTGMKDVFVSTAHASHGLVSSLSSAHYLADVICGTPKSLSAESSAMLAPQRFIDRARKKGQILEGFEG